MTAAKKRTEPAPRRATGAQEADRAPSDSSSEAHSPGSDDNVRKRRTRCSSSFGAGAEGQPRKTGACASSGRPRPPASSSSSSAASPEEDKRRDAAIQEAFLIRPAQLTVGKFVALARASDHALLQLLLRNKAVQFTSVPCFSELTATVYETVQTAEAGAPEDAPASATGKHGDNRRFEELTELLDAPGRHCRTLRRLADVMINMERITNSHRCVPSTGGVSTGPWTEFAPLLSPLEEKPLYLPALLPAFEWIRRHVGGIHMVGCPRKPTARESARWEAWFQTYSELCDANPAISSYLDPSYILWEEGPGVPPSAVTAALLSANDRLSIEIPNAPNPVVPPADAGGASVRLLELAQPLSVTREIASAYRSQLAVPGVPGGGAGPACRIATFSTTTLRWW